MDYWAAWVGVLSKQTAPGGVNWCELASAGWQDLAVSGLAGMNGPAAGRHSAAVQQALFNQQNDRQADGRPARHSHAALAAAPVPNQFHHMMQVKETGRGQSKYISVSTVRSPDCIYIFFLSCFPCIPPSIRHQFFHHRLPALLRTLFLFLWRVYEWLVPC